MMTQEDIAIHNAQNWKAYAQERKLPSESYKTIDFSKTYTWIRLQSMLAPATQVKHAPTLEQMEKARDHYED